MNIRGPVKYAGFAILLVWHYCLWFVPNVFANCSLLDDSITNSWLLVLLSNGVFLLIFSLAAKHREQLIRSKPMLIGSAALLTITTAALTMVPEVLANSALMIAVSLIMGISNGCFWLVWGQKLVSVDANFTIRHIATVCAVILLIGLLLATFLPSLLACIFVSILPLLSLAHFFVLSKFNNKVHVPTYLPKVIAKHSYKNLALVCVIAFVVAGCCYYLTAIIPWVELPLREASFNLGAFCAAFALLLVASLSLPLNNYLNIFRLFPWLIVIAIVAFAMYLATKALMFEAFLVALSISSILEILLVMYLENLALKGYIRPILAFGLAGGSIRLGIFFGNSIAILFEKNADALFGYVPVTASLCIVILSVFLIPMVKEEFSITILTSPVETESEFTQKIIEVGTTFSLSKREIEIMGYLSKGYSASFISEQLVISQNTVHTHIQHIYSKTSVRSKSELINIINNRL